MATAAGRVLLTMQDAYLHLSPLNNYTFLLRRAMALICSAYYAHTNTHQNSMASGSNTNHICSLSIGLCAVLVCLIVHYQESRRIVQPGELLSATTHIHNEDRHWSTLFKSQKQLLINECVQSMFLFLMSYRILFSFWSKKKWAIENLWNVVHVCCQWNK